MVNEFIVIFEQMVHGDVAQVVERLLSNHG